MLLGDTNSSYYHAHASIRRNRNQIQKLSLPNGDQVSNPNGIAQELTNAFVARFSSNISTSFNIDYEFALLDSIISDTNNEFLTSLVTGDEIKNAVFDLDLDKSLGPDSFPPFFFKNTGLWLVTVLSERSKLSFILEKNC